jgi:hypothetical protein
MNDSARSDEGGSDPAGIIERYIAGSDSERDLIAADHPALITEEITQRAEQTRPGPQRTWIGVGARYTTPKRRPDILRAIASLEWHEVDGGESVQPPAAPGLAIKLSIRAMRLPQVDQIAWHGSASVVDWREQHYAIYGMQGHYSNGRARLYVIDVGTVAVPLASDFWPTPGDGAAEVSE